MPRPLAIDVVASAISDAAILLDKDGMVADLNLSASDLLRHWFPAWRLGSALPEPLPSWLRASSRRRVQLPLVVGRDDVRLEVRRISLSDTDVLLLSQQTSGPVTERLRDRGLTPREAQVVQIVADGDTVAQAARKLGISSRTVEKHIQLAYDKLGVHNRACAANLVRELQTQESS
jgi:DNA-binding CsgD family transcriptional regulator